MGPFSHGHESVLHCAASRVQCHAFVVRAAPPARSGPQNLAIPRHSWLCHPDNGETWTPSSESSPSPKCVSLRPKWRSDVASGRLRHRQRQRARAAAASLMQPTTRARAYCVQSSRTYLLSRTPYWREYKSEWEALIRHIVWLYTNESAS